MSLDEEQVLDASKEYDLECVQWLSVTACDLRDVCVLSKCPNIVELDISSNRIFSLRGLEGCIRHVVVVCLALPTSSSFYHISHVSRFETPPSSKCGSQQSLRPF